MNERLSICYSLIEEVIILCLRYAVILQSAASFTQNCFRDFRNPLRCRADLRYFGMLLSIDW